MSPSASNVPPVNAFMVVSTTDDVLLSGAFGDAFALPDARPWARRAIYGASVFRADLSPIPFVRVDVRVSRNLRGSCVTDGSGLGRFFGAPIDVSREVGEIALSSALSERKIPADMSVRLIVHTCVERIHS